MPVRPSPASPPQMLRGALFTLSRRCGKPNCRCAEGDPHQTPALAYPEGGRTKTITLSEAELPDVRAALARYQKAKARLDAAAEAGIASLRARLASRRRVSSR
jgi:hypothetical protein